MGKGKINSFGVLKLLLMKRKLILIFLFKKFLFSFKWRMWKFYDDRWWFFR